ncbi:MAG: SpoIIIAH-like family protein [Erysipelotrichaceae bacterium]|nr:SpoIIIAH-like family protein [Erysipelotrichaceae bacterium]
MNKKLLAFISLFSLTLVLGVYYVMVPFSVPNTNNDDLQVSVSVEEGENAYFVSLELEKESEYELYVSSQEDVVFSSEESNAAKATALNNIYNLNKNRDKEKELKQAIIDLGYKTAFVQIKPDAVKAIVSKKDATPLDAATVIAALQKECGSKMIEVSFK